MRLRTGALLPRDSWRWLLATKFRGEKFALPELRDVTYPAGLSIGKSAAKSACWLRATSSDEALLMNTGDGKIIHRFDLSTFKHIPASLPYTTVTTSDGRRGFVSLWNASSVAELDLEKEASGASFLYASLHRRWRRLHPTALILNRDNSRLFVALTNRDEIAVVDTANGKPVSYLSTKLPGQQYGGSDPEYLALAPTRRRSFPPMPFPIPLACLI